MSGRMMKKLRRMVRRSEVGLAERASKDFKLFIRTLPLRARLVLAYKIARGIM